jgi:uncharacterized membrane protein YhaH (DUF805 family)
MQELNPVQWAILPLKKYATFSGRAPRAEYWWFYLLTVIVGMLAGRLDAAIGDGDTINTISNLAFLLPMLAVTVRRLHDTDRSGWWSLMFFVALAITGAGVVLASIMETRGSSATMFTAMIVAILCLLGAFVSFLVFMVQRGRGGPNRFGPDPYGPSHLEEVFA